MSAKLIGIIKWVANCPKHDGLDFSGLVWFDSIGDIGQWVEDNIQANYFLYEIWDQGRQERSDIRVEYAWGRHVPTECTISVGDKPVLKVVPHPYKKDVWKTICLEDEEL